jgi:hypothetical protein
MPEFWSRRSRLSVTLAVLGPVLGACSSAVPSMPSFSSLFGSGSNSAAAGSNAAAAYTPPANFECPGVSIRQGAGAFSMSANPAEPSATNLRYQFALGDTARECRLIGPMLSMKVGVRGRVILGPAGGPGQLDVPLRFAVVREGVEPKTITTKLQHLVVTIPPNDGNVVFSHVEDELTFPMPPGGQIDSYVVYIGFDPQGAQDLDKKKPAPKSARPRRQN